MKFERMWHGPPLLLAVVLCRERWFPSPSAQNEPCNESPDQTSHVGFLRLQSGLALLLFLPAGSLDYWEAWIYLTLFAISALLMTRYLLKHDPALINRRLEVGPGAEPETTQKIIQAFAIVLTCALVALPGFDHRFHGSCLPAPLVLSADAIAIVGLLIIFRAFKENTYAAATVRVEVNQRVISAGPYAWIRHPLYAGSALLLLATPFALGSLWTLLPAILFCGLLMVRLLYEERYLSANLPGYEAYCRKVPHRLVPGLW